jgi:hypothetical protein
LKRTAQDDCSKQEQPSKKQARQQLLRPVSPTSALDSPSTSLNSPPLASLDLPSDPPETFKCALDMLISAWKEKYHTLKFPIKKQVFFLPMSKCPLAPQRTTKQGHHGRDIRLSSGHVVDYNVPMNYSLVANNDLSRFQRERVIVNAMKKVMNLKSNQPTSRTHHLLDAFVALHP